MCDTVNICQTRSVVQLLAPDAHNYILRVFGVASAAALIWLRHCGYVSTHGGSSNLVEMLRIVLQE